MNTLTKSYRKLAFFLIPAVSFAQNPVSLRSDVKVEFIMNIKKKAARVAKDPISGNLFYITSSGNVYEIKNLNTSPSQTLLYTEANHGIAYLQGMTFIDNSLFLIGNKMIDSTGNVGMIKKAVLQPDGSRSWFSVATTAVYPQSYTWYDHGFSGLVASPDKNYLYFSSGSRTDHGEIQSNNGLYPGLREVPLTSALFRIPANSVNLILPNDDNGLAPYLYAEGLRNAFDMAFDANDQLFATENSGDRDDPDEINWIRQGKHYGFPWIMGGNDNPQQFPGYDPTKDVLLNTKSHCYLKGYYCDDPAFPSKGSLAFTPSIKNLGPDADKFRENSGKVNDGSSSGKNVKSVTPHRSPLGISIDRNKILGADLTGDAFVVSFTRKGDSTGLDVYGYPGTIVDPGQDLLHIKFLPDGAGEYEMQATSIVKNFDYPVDTYLDENVLYVIEYNDNADGRLFKVTLPPAVVAVNTLDESQVCSIYPNPTRGIFTVNFNGSTAVGRDVCVYDILGNCILKSDQEDEDGQNADGCSSLSIDLSGQSKGIYFVQVLAEGKREMKKLVLH